LLPLWSSTRYYLEWVSYPQIGGGELHIAHLLWGGLTLFIVGLLPLIFANRRTYDWAAVLSGVDVGLFIDDTKNNDYLRRVGRLWFQHLTAPKQVIILFIRILQFC